MYNHFFQPLLSYAQINNSFNLMPLPASVKVNEQPGADYPEFPGICNWKNKCPFLFPGQSIYTKAE